VKSKSFGTRSGRLRRRAVRRRSRGDMPLLPAQLFRVLGLRTLSRRGFHAPRRAEDCVSWCSAKTGTLPRCAQRSMNALTASKALPVWGRLLPTNHLPRRWRSESFVMVRAAQYPSVSRGLAHHYAATQALDASAGLPFAPWLRWGQPYCPWTGDDTSPRLPSRC